MSGKGKYVEITAADTDTEILKASDIEILNIREIRIENKSGAAATVELKDVYTRYYAGSSESHEETKLKKDIAADAVIRYNQIRGMKVLGTLKARSSSASSGSPVRIYVGVEPE